MIKRTIKITNRSLSKIQKEMGWKGIGSPEDPIIIDSINDHRLALKLKNIDKHILFKDIMTVEIRLVKCINTIIRDCKIYHILLTACSKISVINCSIVHGYLTYSKGNVFNNNFLQKDLASITLKSKQGDNTAKTMHVVYSLPFCFLIFAFILALFSNNFIIFLTSLVAIPFFSLPIIDLRIKKYKTINLPENIFENNEESDLSTLSQTYADYRL